MVNFNFPDRNNIITHKISVRQLAEELSTIAKVGEEHGYTDLALRGGAVRALINTSPLSDTVELKDLDIQETIDVKDADKYHNTGDFFSSSTKALEKFGMELEDQYSVDSDDGIKATIAEYYPEDESQPSIELGFKLGTQEQFVNEPQFLSQAWQLHLSPDITEQSLKAIMGHSPKELADSKKLETLLNDPLDGLIHLNPNKGRYKTMHPDQILMRLAIEVGKTGSELCPEDKKWFENFMTENKPDIYDYYTAKKSFTKLIRIFGTPNQEKAIEFLNDYGFFDRLAGTSSVDQKNSLKQGMLKLAGSKETEGKKIENMSKLFLANTPQSKQKDVIGQLNYAFWHMSLPEEINIPTEKRLDITA